MAITPNLASTNNRDLIIPEAIFPEGEGVNGEVSGENFSVVCLSRIERVCPKCDFVKDCSIKISSERVGG